MIAARVHIFTDGLGWSSRRDADYTQLKIVQNASELPPLAQDCLITFFNASDAGDLEHLQDRIQELRTNARWNYEE